MLKIKEPTKERLQEGAIIHDDFIVERTSKAGEQVFGIMFEEENTSLTAGFAGGKKYAFITAGSLETMKNVIADNNLKLEKPIEGNRIVYTESTDTNLEDNPKYSKIPVIFVDDAGEKYTKENVFLTHNNKDIYRKSEIVASNDQKQDIMLEHDRINTTVSAKDLANAAKTIANKK